MASNKKSTSAKVTTNGRVLAKSIAKGGRSTATPRKPNGKTKR